jgi:hypothetical protein
MGTSGISNVSILSVRRWGATARYSRPGAISVGCWPSCANWGARISGACAWSYGVAWRSDSG